MKIIMAFIFGGVVMVILESTGVKGWDLWGRFMAIAITGVIYADV